MTNEEPRRSLVPGILVKVGLPLLIGLIALLAAHFGGLPGWGAGGPMHEPPRSAFV